MNRTRLTLAQIFSLSRPSNWVITLAPFLAASLAVSGTLSLKLVIAAIFFTLPFNFFRWSAETHYFNSSRLLKNTNIWFWALVLNLPFAIYLLISTSSVAKIILLLCFGLVYLCFWAPFKLKTIPIIDLVATVLITILPGLFGLYFVAPSESYGLFLGIFILWAVGVFAVNNIAELNANRRLKVSSTVNLLGVKKAVNLAFWCFLAIAILVSVFFFPLGIIAGILLTGFALSASFFLKFKSDAKAKNFARAAKNNIALNNIAGYGILALVIYAINSISNSGYGVEFYAKFLILLAIIQTLVIMHNMLGFRRPKLSNLADFPSVSVLIHAFNQADNISSTLLAILGQNYPDFEILFADLGSDDNTLRIADSYQDDRIKIVQIAPMPKDWTINAWASAQLLEQARGEIIISLSADTVLLSDTIAALVGLIENNKLDMVSLLPSDQNKTLAQKFLLSLNRFFWLGMYPAAYLTKNWPKYSAAYSGLLAARRTELVSIGGFGLVKRSPLEDLDLAAYAKQNGLKTGFWLGSDLAVTQNHVSLRLILLQNIARYYPSLRYNFPLSFFAILAGFFVLCIPTVVGLTALIGGSQHLFILFLIGYAMMVVNRLIIAITSRQSYLAVLFYPITSLISFVLLFLSIINYELLKPRWAKRTEV